MRIGLVTGEYPPLQGGVGAFTQELARHLFARGHEIHVLTSRAARPALPAGEREPWQKLSEPVEVPYGLVHARARRWRWRDVGLLADLAQRYKLDVLNIQYQAAAYNMNSAAINLAPWRLRGLATVAVTFHDLRVPYLFPRAGRLRSQAVKAMARSAGGVIATNRPDYERLRSWNVPEARLRQIPIGSNIAVRPRREDGVAAVRQRLGLHAADSLLGYFGFLNESKGADLLLQALAHLPPEIHLVFIGGRTGTSDQANNQAFVDEMDGLIARLGLEERVHSTGFLDDAAVSAHLHAADLIVLPYRDGLSLRRGTLMAALAHGRPLISTEPDAPPETLQHGKEVWMVPRDDAPALAQAITTLLDDPDLRARLGKAAALRATDFSWPAIAAATATFFDELRGAG